MSIRFRNKDGKVNDKPSLIDCRGGVRDDVILDTDGVKEILAKYYQQLYGQENPPDVTITCIGVLQEPETLVEIEFTEVEYPIPF